MNRQLIFVDDSGDPGFKSVSSSNFVMAAAVFIDQEVALKLSGEITKYRLALGWNEKYEFKFAKIRKDIISEVLKLAKKYNFQIFAVYIDKTNFRKTTLAVDNEKLYNWTLKELLLSVPLSDDVKIMIDGRSSKSYMQQATTYLRRQLKAKGSKKIKILFEDSTDDNLIQLADLVAGSINRHLNGDKTDAEVYCKILSKKIVQIKQLMG